MRKIHLSDLRLCRVGISPWMLSGVACILIVVMAGLFQRSNERERSFMVRNLTDRAEALIWALEAGTRLGMRMNTGVIMGLSPLLAETARQPGIVYMVVADAQGKILAFSGDGVDRSEENDPVAPSGVEEDMPVMPSLEAVSDKAAWRMRELVDGSKVFEVYRTFAPLRFAHVSQMRHVRHGMARSMPMNGSGCPAIQAQPTLEHTPGLQGSSVKHERQAVGVALVGFDARPFEEALRRDMRNNLLSALLAVVLALAGFISLSWIQQYRRWRRMLRDERAIAASVIADLPLGLVTSDPYGRIAVINDTALAMFHKGRKDIVSISQQGGKVDEASPLRSLPGLDWDGLVTRLAKTGRLSEEELDLTIPGGDGMTISLGAAAVRNENNVFLGNVFVLRDITEMKRLQAEAQRNDRLAALGHLAAGVAHEIRNPLSTIKGVALYIARRMPSAGREADAASRMIDEVDRLDRVVSSLLEFARPDNFKTSPAELGAIVDHALRLAETDLGKDIAVVRDIPSSFPQVHVNADRLTQALLNLILNAVQAMKSCGTLSIKAELTEKGKFRLVVSDTGPGVASELRSSIFTPYFTTKPSGTGLGLAIVHRVAEGHGGSVSVGDTPGGGAAFTMTLPVEGKSVNRRNPSSTSCV